VKFAFIRDHRAEFCVQVMCDVFAVTRAGFYAWLDRPESPRATRARELAEQIRLVHRETDGVYGSIKITRELRARDHHANRKTIAGLMNRMGIRSKVCRKFKVRTTDSNHDQPIAPNTLEQDFAAADAPDKIWAADITYIHTDDGFLYLAGVMDLFSRKIIGWSMQDTLATELVEAAFDMAIGARAPASGLLHHSDRGCQYASRDYREKLRSMGVEMSMSRQGNGYDNAMVESFWGKLKAEMVNHRRFATHEEARVAIFEYIEMFYNPKRLHASLDYVSPARFEAKFANRQVA
jgi:transposase InsO family protein